MPELPSVSLSTIAAGVVAERFDFAMKQMLDDVVDPNKPASKKRVVVITLEFEPDEKRERIEMGIDVNFKPVKSHKANTVLFVGESREGYFVTEINPKQKRLFEEDAIPGPRAAVSTFPPRENQG